MQHISSNCSDIYSLAKVSGSLHSLFERYYCWLPDWVTLDATFYLPVEWMEFKGKKRFRAESRRYLGYDRFPIAGYG
jgi:hypothetical protein